MYFIGRSGLHHRAMIDYYFLVRRIVHRLYHDALHVQARATLFASSRGYGSLQKLNIYFTQNSYKKKKKQFL